MQTKLTMPANSNEKLPEPEPIKLKMPDKSPTQPERLTPNPQTVEGLIEYIKIAFAQEGFTGFDKISIVGRYGQNKITLGYDRKKAEAAKAGGAK